MKVIVYRTENTLNGKFYYGVHSKGYKHYLGSGSLINKAIKKHGRDNFVRRTIKEFDNEKDAYHLESIIVDKTLVNNPDCYNVALGGSMPTNGFAGKTHSEESRVKMRGKAYVRTPEHNRNMSAAKAGTKMSDIAKANMSKSQTGNNNRGITVTAHGIDYPNIKSCADFYGVYPNTMKSWCLKDTKPDFRIKYE